MIIKQTAPDTAYQGERGEPIKVFFAPALTYFALVFGAGFALGAVRVLWLVPQFGVRAVRYGNFRKLPHQKGSLTDPIDEPANFRRREVATDLLTTRGAPRLLELWITRNKLEPTIEPSVDKLVRFRVDPNQCAEQYVRIEDDPQRPDA